jgi:hypothetical protein
MPAQSMRMLRGSLTCVQEADAAPARERSSGGACGKPAAGLGANLVSTMRSFLPFVSKQAECGPLAAAGKKPVKVLRRSLSFALSITAEN